MAKRFRNNERWKKSWWKKLGPHGRDLLSFLEDNCDHAGVWDEDYEMISLRLGLELNRDGLISLLGDRVRIIDEEKLLICDFIREQYGALGKKSGMHLNVINQLRSHGIDPREFMEATGDSITEIRRAGRILLDNFTCAYCSTNGSLSDLSVSFITPLANGGTDDDENLATICQSCLHLKGDSNVFHFVAANNLADKLSPRLSAIVLKPTLSPGLSQGVSNDSHPARRVKEKEEEKERGNGKGKEENSKKNDATHSSGLNVLELVELWNTHMGTMFGFSSGLGDGGLHLNAQKALEIVSTEDGWVEIFGKLKASAWHSGDNRDGWVASLPWLVIPDNLRKIAAMKLISRTDMLLSACKFGGVPQ